jgi:hypothetical protein
VCRDLGAGLSPEELIAELDACGVASGERSLILIDGVNEGPRDAWCAAIAELTRLVAARNHVALVVSARTPFEEIVLSQGERDRMVSLTHAGFTDREFDAQAEFFRYYHVPLPEVPLLDEEFSRPLTLKLICEAFRDLRTRKLRDGFTGVASGQKGMTFVFEVFVNRIGADIEREFGLPAKTEIIEGRKPGDAPAVRRIRAAHALSLREYVSYRTALRVIAAQLPQLPGAK